jgi:hypothetical protein
MLIIILNQMLLQMQIMIEFMYEIKEFIKDETFIFIKCLLLLNHSYFLLSLLLKYKKLNYSL